METKENTKKVYSFELEEHEKLWLKELSKAEGRSMAGQIKWMIVTRHNQIVKEKPHNCGDWKE